MTAQEVAKVQENVHHDQRVYANDDPNHDRYGCDTRNAAAVRFDASHTEDVFPY